jgi:hypothetical protein
MCSSDFCFRHTVLLTACIVSVACATGQDRTLITIADARTAAAQAVDTGAAGDSAGDMVLFDQPLLDEHGAVIGNNSGVCIRTRVAHSYQCQWTLALENGTIQVAGRETDRGTSPISIVGGTGAYAGISGDMVSTNNNDGTFTQILRFRLK